MSNRAKKRPAGLNKRRKVGLVGLATAMVAGPFASLQGVSPATFAAPGPVTASLFYDGNFDGNRNATETFGPGGVVVRAYDMGNALAGSGVTDENGNVTFTPTGSGP